MDRGVGVVDDEDGQAGRVGDDVTQRHVGPAEVGGRVDDAARADDAGGADTDAEQRRRGGGDDLVHEVEDRVDDGLAGVVADRALGADEDVAVEVEHGGAQHLVGGEVDADGLQAGAVDVDEGARLAGAHDLGGAELDGVTAVHESETRSETVTLLIPRRRARSARLIAPTE